MARHRLLIVLALMISMLLLRTPAYALVRLSVLWMRPPEPASFELLGRFAAEFEIQNPNVRVEVTAIDFANGRDFLKKAAINGTMPDIAMTAARWIPEFVSLGLIEPLDRYITPEFRDRFMASVIDKTVVYEGRVFGLPVGISTRALYYNKTLFKQASVQNSPKSWDELLSASKAITALDKGAYGFGLQGGGGPETNTYFYYFIWGNSGTLFNKSGSAATLNTPEVVEALTFLQHLIQEKGTQPEPTSKAYERLRNLEESFQGGKLGMVISGPWLAQRLHREAPDLDFGIAPIPYHTTPVNYGVVDAVVISSASPRKDTAWQFLDFIFQDTRRLAYTQRLGVLPALKSLANSPEFTQNPDYAVFLAELPDARFEPQHVQSEDIAQAVIEAIQPVYRGQVEPRPALQFATEKINKLLATTASGW